MNSSSPAMRALTVLLLLAVAALAAAKAPAKAPAGQQVRRPGRPTARPALGVRQQGDEYVDPDVIKSVFTTPSPDGDRGGDDKEQLSQEFICSVFGGPSCPDDQPQEPVPCLCDSAEACQCVPYYQCDKASGSFNEFGVGVIDIRQGNTTCPHYIYKCCSVSRSPGDGPPTDVGQQPPFTPDPFPPKQSEEPQPTPDYRPPTPESTPDPYGPQPGGEQTPDPYQPSTPDYYPNNPEPTPDTNPNPPTHLPAPDPAVRPRCGVRNPDGVGVRITGDEDGEAQFGEFPWMVAILKVETDEDEKKRNLYQCGGALITPQVVLTAAHCVKKNNPRQLKVRAGEWDTQTSKEMYRHQDVLVEDVIVHPDYYAGAVHNDVALLFLNDPVHVGYHIGTICMPEQDQNFDYNKCFVSGWGKDKFGQQGRYQVILKKLELPIVPHDQCQDQLRKTRLGNYFTLHHSFICAGGEEGKDTCKGDGGSPLVCPIPHDPTRYQLAGTVAWGIDCGLAGVPGVYGNVALFRNWVDEQMRAHNLDDSPYLP